MQTMQTIQALENKLDAIQSRVDAMRAKGAAVDAKLAALRKAVTPIERSHIVQELALIMATR